MALHPENESIRASLLHRDPLPTLDTTIKEIIFYETRLGLNKPTLRDVVAAVRPPTPKFSSVRCKNCQQSGHLFSACPKVECRYHHETGHIIKDCLVRPPYQSRVSTKQGVSSTSEGVSSSPPPASSSIATTVSDVSRFLTLNDLEALLKQIIPSSSSSQLALIVVPYKGSSNEEASWDKP
ncbi:Zinc finger, CCHC-type [Corchorus olitorius]|uniref:Zinc finger, CCHC-type n=1 Tax=Corchorus olitorius TaxID=93759 RepID=A0A1R3KTB1_9ROSI|nr:Zinc finger, CCHC-type [Corchorus olitorius]